MTTYKVVNGSKTRTIFNTKDGPYAVEPGKTETVTTVEPLSDHILGLMAQDGCEVTKTSAKKAKG